MSSETNVIWHRVEGTMPEHVKCVVEAAQNKLMLKGTSKNLAETTFLLGKRTNDKEKIERSGVFGKSLKKAEESENEK